MVMRPKKTRDNLQAHYTASSDIVCYMCSRLLVSTEDAVWEPGAGRGHLIDGVLGCNSGVRIVANEINQTALSFLETKYANFANIDIRRTDALLEPITEKFTRVIANPPYGAWQEHERRQDLKQRFGHLYVKDTYAVFLYYALLKTVSSGRLVFIVPDTFLWLHRHEQLRRHLFSTTTIEEIALFPSKFFPGIQFGYSGLCIITITNTVPHEAHCIRVVHDIRNAAVLSRLAHEQPDPGSCHINMIAQSAIASHRHFALTLSGDHRPVTSAVSTLGDVAQIVTGFYSGNDPKWITRLGGGGGRSSRLHIVSQDLISPTGQEPPLDGITDSRCFVPIVRGGAAQFVKPTRFFVDWSREAVAEYRRK